MGWQWPALDVLRAQARQGGVAHAMWGIDGYDATVALTTALGAGVLGATGVGVSVVFVLSIDAVPAGTQRIGHNRNGNTGWFISSNGANLEASAGTGAAIASAPVRAWVAGDVGKVHVVAFSCDATQIVMYYDRAQVGLSTAMANYVAPAGVRQGWGSQPGGGNPGTNYRIHGVVGRNSPLTLADFQVICDASKTARSLALGGVAMEHLWRAPPPPMPNTVADAIGADTMSITTGVAASLNVAPMPSEWGF